MGRYSTAGSTSNCSSKGGRSRGFDAFGFSERAGGLTTGDDSTRLSGFAQTGRGRDRAAAVGTQATVSSPRRRRPGRHGPQGLPVASSKPQRRRQSPDGACGIVLFVVHENGT